MARQIRTLTPLLVAAAIALPALALAQPPAPPMQPRMQPPMQPAIARPSGVTRLINARRQLDLTARQLVQLDSLERVQFAQRRALQERLQGQRDSLMQRRSELRGQSRDSIRAVVQARMEALRPQLEQARRSDSLSMAAAERILNDTQRQKLREMQAEERGRQRGLREAQMRGRQAPEGQLRQRLMQRRQMPDAPMPGRMRQPMGGQRGMRQMPPDAPPPENRAMPRRPRPGETTG